MKKMILLSILCISLLLSGCAASSNQAKLSNPAANVSEPSATINAQEETPEPAIIDEAAPPQVEPGTVDSTEPTPSPTEEPMQHNINLVPYDGVVEHIFFHPLIAYPELAFDDDYQSQGYNDFFTTVPEFVRIIEELYARDFILVHLSDVFQEQQLDGELQVTKQTMMLPEGKKPIVISIDDLNYYEYMIQNGNVYKLILDDSGNIATYSINPQGEEVVSYEDEIVPILDSFVEKHPDFSLNGAKGTIALTGYEGVLGYRTHADSPNRHAEIEKAKEVIQRLKETGWIFASHSYGHISVANASLEKLKADTEKWKAEVESLVGETPLYIYPYGARPEFNSDKEKYLADSGYKVLSAVGPTSYTKVTDNAYTMDRRHMDGIAFITQKKTLVDLFDPDVILDKEARPAKYLQ